MEVVKCITNGNVTYHSSRPLKVINRTDFTLIYQGESTIDIELIPSQIKSLLNSRWLYVIHHTPLLFSTVESKTLDQRVKGGELLAHTNMYDCSIGGTPFTYFGFLPTIEPKKMLKGSHKTCRFPLKQIWPRSLFIFIKEDKRLCPCSKECGPRWICRLSDYSTTKSYCIKQIPWKQQYILMGDIDENEKIVKEIKRSCNVCSQCRRCARSTSRCRAHVVCKHKHLKIPKTFSRAKIKWCMKYRQGFN